MDQSCSSFQSLVLEIDSHSTAYWIYFIVDLIFPFININCIYPAVRYLIWNLSGCLCLCFCRAELRSHENSGHQWCLFSGYLYQYINLKPENHVQIPAVIFFFFFLSLGRFACKYVVESHKPVMRIKMHFPPALWRFHLWVRVFISSVNIYF